MRRTEDDGFWDLLAHWEECYRQGRDIPAEQLCQGRPDLLPDVQDNIRSLKAMDRLLRSEPEDNASCQSVPERLGEYVILQRLGAGGMGQVYKALHRRMNRIAAVKVLPGQTLASAATLQRFHQEIQSAAKLAHPNVVAAYDAGECEGTLFLAMEYMEGCDLLRHVRERGPLPVAQAVDFIRQAARGLDYAHGKGVVHRDVKPSNLLLSEAGTIKVLDMGLARFKPADRAEALMGSADFLAPEQTSEGGSADERSDIYSLGCTLFFLLTGKAVFEGSVFRKLVAHRVQPVPSLRRLRPDVPTWLDSVFRKMTAKKPEERFQSMAEVVRVLGVGAASRRRLLAGGLTLLLLAGLVGGWMLSGEPPLARLNLDFTDIDDEALRQLPDLENLGELRLTRTKITDDGLRTLLTCKRLEFLDIGHNPITDAGLETLAELGQLRHLGLSLTKITDSGLAHLVRLKRLQHLNLDYTQIGDEGLAHLRGMTSLQDLRLTQTKITDAGLTHLGGLTRLNILDLGRTAITDSGLKSLDALPELRQIVLAGTKVTLRRTQ